MTMFQELFALAASATLAMTVSADKTTGRMTINVIPKPRKDANEPALTQPLSLTATPQEFDTGFIAALSGYREVRQSLEQQAEATKVVLEAAKAASVKKASDATSKAAGAPAKSAVAASKPLPAPSSTHAPASSGDEVDEPDDAGGAPSERDAGSAAQAAAATGGESYDLFG